MINCIDISTWNTNVNYRAVKSDGVVAAILRAGYGREVSQIDSRFEEHYKGCREAGLKIGIYWYSYANSITDAEREAKACLAILNGRHVDLPVYFDMEESWQTSLGRVALNAMAEAFCEVIRFGGYKPGVYSNLNWFSNYLDYDRLSSKYSIWLAQWSGSHSLDCDIWQNSESGDIDGVPGSCDTNVILNMDIIGGDVSPVERGVTAQEAVNMAYSLINTDVNPRKCDVMEWYGGFDDDLDEEACCCAGMMYLFNKLGALNLIPGGKTANCGTLAKNFYDAGQLHKPDEARVGDLAIFSWDGDATSVKPLDSLGYKTLQHVELITAVNGSEIVSVGVNNGGKECDDWQEKTHERRFLSACCRPDYDGKGESAPEPEPYLEPTEETNVQEVQRWLNENFNAELDVDGIYGRLTNAALVRALQTVLNRDFSANLDVDGVFGKQTKKSIVNLERGAYGDYVRVLQGFLICHGYDTGGFDGDFGARTESAVKTFQSVRGLYVDGISGRKTLEELANS